MMEFHRCCKIHSCKTPERPCENVQFVLDVYGCLWKKMLVLISEWKADPMQPSANIKMCMLDVTGKLFEDNTASEREDRHLGGVVLGSTTYSEI